MSLFGYMEVYCPICKSRMDGMNAVGRDAHCCSKECNDEWNWRRSLAICNEPYRPHSARFATQEDIDASKPTAQR